MAKFLEFQVTILIEDGSDLLERIQKSADLRGITLQSAIQEAVDIGLWHHMARNMDTLEQIYNKA